MKRTPEEVKAHYEYLRTKKRRSQSDRIFMYVFRYRENGCTAHEIVDQYFFVKQGDRITAGDGGSRIPWQSAGGAIKNLVEEGWLIRTTWTIDDPVTRSPGTTMLFPAHVPEQRWMTPQSKLL